MAAAQPAARSSLTGSRTRGSPQGTRSKAEHPASAEIGAPFALRSGAPPIWVASAPRGFGRRDAGTAGEAVSFHP
jgi:hypothetical protein